MELQREQTPPQRLLCYCGKPLDRFGTMAWPDAPRALVRHTGRHRQESVEAVEPGTPSGEDARMVWNCRRCRSRVALRADTIHAAYRRAEADGRADVVVGVDT
ncbi:MAG: hypothetical protein R6T85_06300 [Egibacteraceae bacterium]